MERKVLTYKDLEEAKKYIGKRGLLTQDYRAAVEGTYKGNRKTVRGTLASVSSENGGYPFQAEERVWAGYDSDYQFFVPDPEPVEKWVPFTADDWEMFAGKFVKKPGDEGATAISAFGPEYVWGFDFEESYADLLSMYIFVDGTPCGKKIQTTE